VQFRVITEMTRQRIVMIIHLLSGWKHIDKRSIEDKKGEERS
jgi:hypothetical protein